MAYSKHSRRTLLVRATILSISIATVATEHAESRNYPDGTISTFSPESGRENSPFEPTQNRMTSIVTSTSSSPAPVILGTPVFATTGSS